MLRDSSTLDRIRGLTTLEKYLRLTQDELNRLVTELKKIFDIVRVVDASLQRTVVFDEQGSHVDEHRNCFEVWNKRGRCENCISARAFSQKGKFSKFEFIGNEIYYVTSQYLEVDGIPYLLEIVQKNKDFTIDGAFGKENFIEKIKGYASELYTDSLTHANNRRYYDDQIKALPMAAVAMMDVDHFKSINDTYGHACGDRALQEVAEVIERNVRSSDNLIRYGGDEFLLAFPTMKSEYLYAVLEKIRRAVETCTLKDYPDLHITLSIGGAFGHASVEKLMLAADKELYKAKVERNKTIVDQKAVAKEG